MTVADELQLHGAAERRLDQMLTVYRNRTPDELVGAINQYVTATGRVVCALDQLLEIKDTPQ